MNPIKTKKDARKLEKAMIADSSIEIFLFDGMEANRLVHVEVEDGVSHYIAWEDTVNGTKGRDFFYPGSLADILYLHREFINASGWLENIHIEEVAK